MLSLLAAAVLMPLVGTLSYAQPKQDHRMDWFKEARFGMFIHWGLYAVPAGEWPGKGKGHGEWIRESAQIPVTEYEKLLDKFNPVKFNAEKIVKTAKDAGMKYVVITTKHHDGFALFDSKWTDWDVMSTPFKRDIMKEMAAACKKYGMKMCWYHSIMDWHHPDYLPRRSWEVANRPVDGADMNRYVEYLHNQVTELLTNYGPIGIMWFDGEWESTWNHKYGQALYDLCRKLQPNVIVNNRVDVGRGGMGGMSDAGFAGDYGTPEQEIPATGIPGVTWETCMTMNDHWGFNKVDKNFKSTKEIIRMLCDIASKGGNYLLNVGPTSEGVIPDESVQRLKKVGDWMKVNGDAIYGTEASPFKKLDWGRCTVKKTGSATRLYLHVFDWPKDGKLTIPGLGNKVTRAILLSQPKTKITASHHDADVTIDVPKTAPDAICSVIWLDIVGAPVIYDTPEFSASTDEFVSTLKLQIKTSSPEIDVRYTLDGSEPKANSAKYSGGIEISSTATVKARAFRGGKAVSGIGAATFTKVKPWPAFVNDKTPEPGLLCRIYEGSWDAVPDWTKLQCLAIKTEAGVQPYFVKNTEFVGNLIEGSIIAPETDVYRFALRSDDGSRLWIDGKLVVDHDGLHSPTEKMGHAPLEKGLHQLKVEWFNKSGGYDLALSWGRGGGDLKKIAAKNLVR